MEFTQKEIKLLVSLVERELKSAKPYRCDEAETAYGKLSSMLTSNVEEAAHEASNVEEETVYCTRCVQPTREELIGGLCLSCQNETINQ